MEKMALRFNRVITEFLCRSEADRNEADEIDAGSGPDFTRSRRGRGDHAGAHSTRALPDFLPDLLIGRNCINNSRGNVFMSKGLFNLGEVHVGCD
jgi:hypothetical protein